MAAIDTSQPLHSPHEAFDLYLFGPPRLRAQGGVLNVGLRKAMALFSFLIVEAKPQARDSLAAMLWPESAQREARASLRRTFYRLQQLLGTGRFGVNADYIVADPSRISADIQAFERTADLIASFSADTSAGLLARAEQAVGAYGGGFMAGFNLPDCPEFDSWQRYQRERFAHLHDTLLAFLASRHAAAGAFDRALEFARCRLTIDPANEAAHRQIMTLYAGTGRRGAALRQFEHCTRTLRDLLGEEPSLETVQLLHAMRADFSDVGRRAGAAS